MTIAVMDEQQQKRFEKALKRILNGRDTLDDLQNEVDDERLTRAFTGVDSAVEDLLAIAQTYDVDTSQR